MSVLSGRTVLVTGAARGIGAATARAAAARGARVALVGLEPDRLEPLAAELGGVWFAADVTGPAALDAAVAGTLDAYGRVDAVVANAGVASRGTVAVGDRAAAVRTVEVNLIGVMRTVAATVSPVVDVRGYFLLVSSAAAFLALPGMAAYNAAKAGVEAYGTTMRRELAHRGVGVGTAHPSWVDTDLVRDARDDLPGFAATVARIPRALGGVTSVERCAAAFVDAIERRRRRVYVPPLMAAASLARTVVNGPLGDLVIRRSAAVSVPALEERVRELGRGFGRHTPG